MVSGYAQPSILYIIVCRSVLLIKSLPLMMCVIPFILSSTAPAKSSIGHTRYLVPVLGCGSVAILNAGQSRSALFFSFMSVFILSTAAPFLASPECICFQSALLAAIELGLQGHALPLFFNSLNSSAGHVHMYMSPFSSSCSAIL